MGNDARGKRQLRRTVHVLGFYKNGKCVIVFFNWNCFSSFIRHIMCVCVGTGGARLRLFLLRALCAWSSLFHFSGFGYECLIDWWHGFALFLCFCNLNRMTAADRCRCIHVDSCLSFVSAFFRARSICRALTDGTSSIFNSLNDLFVFFSDFVFAERSDERKGEEETIFFLFGKHLLRFWIVRWAVRRCEYSIYINDFALSGCGQCVFCSLRHYHFAVCALLVSWIAMRAQILLFCDCYARTIIRYEQWPWPDNVEND